MASLVSDPIDLAVDADGNLVFTDGDLTWTSGLAGVVDQCHLALLSIRGEWFLDLEEGIPYYEGPTVPAGEALLGNVFDEERALAEFRNALLGVSNVSKVLHLAITFDGATRDMLVEFRLRTTWGDSDLEEASL